VTLALPEDADSIQMGLGEVIRLILTNRINHQTAALLVYTLQTASVNLRYTSLQPEPTRVVIDREAAARRPLGTSAWSKVEGREYDDLMEDVRTGNGWKENSVDQFDKENTALGPTPPYERMSACCRANLNNKGKSGFEKQRRLEAEAKRSQEIPI